MIHVIITHFDPNDTDRRYRRILRKTIASVRRQWFASQVHITVVDDGSAWSAGLAYEEDETRVFERDEIRQESALNDLDVDLYLLRPPRHASFRKAILLNEAVSLTRGDKLVFLDDDHPFLVPWAVKSYVKRLERYEFVIGRLMNRNRTVRMYGDSLVQGTNIGIRRDTLLRTGGFGEHTAQWGGGVDPDLFWRLYLALNDRSTHAACFAGWTLTRDMVSGRWSEYVDREQRRKWFHAAYGVDMHDNQMRRKASWIAYDRQFPQLHEFAWTVWNRLIEPGPIGFARKCISSVLPVSFKRYLRRRQSVDAT